MATSKRRRGHDPVPQDVLRNCTILYFESMWTVDRIAALYGVSTRTIHNWVNKALQGPDAEEFKVLANRCAHRRGRFVKHSTKMGS